MRAKHPKDGNHDRKKWFGANQRYSRQRSKNGRGLHSAHKDRTMGRDRQ